MKLTDMHFLIRVFIVILSSLCLLLACKGNEMPKESSHIPSIREIPASDWDKLAQKRIVFAHQSVGDDIVNGMRDVMKEHPEVRLRILETKNLSDFSSPLFAHFHVGRNTDPQSKMADFSASLIEGIGEKVDFALLKLCFIDVLPTSDVLTVFNDYRSTFAKLKANLPNVQFIHFTVPLTSESKGMKGWIKKVKDLVKLVVGKVNFFDNTKRNQINDLLRQEYEGKEPLFDLAKIEASVRIGDSYSVPEGEGNYSLNPEYTDDGGHLNQKGRKIVAEQLIILLGQLAEKQ